MSALEWAERVSDALDRVARALVAVLVAVMSIVLIAQVFFRFVLQNSLSWSEELSRYLFVWVSMLGAGIALRQHFHPGLTLVVDRLPPRARAAVKVLAQLLVLALLIVVIREGYELGRMNAWQRSPAMGIPMTYPYAAVWVGAAVMAVHVVRFLLQAMVALLGWSAEPAAKTEPLPQEERLGS
ncbi:MAG: TRAP transporter small permease [Firmicutes bacterium]|nr:TRAP transporter small permease [Bacillota bacterium]